jgi:hypothetical protein
MGRIIIAAFLLASSVGCSNGFNSNHSESVSLESDQNGANFVFMSLSSVAGFTDNSFSLSNFTLSFDAVPSQNNADIVIGLSQNAAGSFGDLAAIVRFNSDGLIDARNGGAYAAAAAVSYSAGRSYHFEMSVDVPNHKYSVKVKPAGKTAVQLAQHYSFRSEQASVTSLGSLNAYGNPGNIKVSKISIAINLPDMSSSTPSPDPTTVVQDPAPTPAPTPVTTAGDGSANAPAGVAQKPNLFTGMKVRPPFKVAGVDYAVGIPAGLTLKNPASIAMAGVSVDTGSKVVTVTGANVTLTGYDFSNWTVETSSANTRIIQSKFFVGPVVGLRGSSNLYVGYCVIDANNTQGSVWGGLISTWSDGLTVEYSWLKNGAGDLIQQVGDNTSSIIIRYNLLEQAGMGAGAHGDYTQLAGPSKVLKMIGNTAVQSGGTTQGLMTEYAASGEISNNVMVGSMSYATSLDLSNLTSQMLVHDNYYANLGYGFVYPNSGPGDSSSLSLFKNNVNMATGAVLQDP